VVDRLRPRLRTFRDERGRELFDGLDGPLPDPDTVVPVRFLPTFDNILLSHKDRGRVLGEQDEWSGGPNQFADAFRGGSVLVDGFVRAGWRVERQKGASGRATLVVVPVVVLTRPEETAVTDEAERLLAFLAADAGDRDVRVDRRLAPG
jgi:hypothetical protein